MSNKLKIYPATLTSKGQITIPQKVRECLELNTGDIISFKINKDSNVITLEKGVKECDICHGEKIINDKTCFACEGKGTLDVSKSIFDYFDSLRKYDVYASLSYEEINNQKRMKRKIPLITLLNDSYPKDIIDKFKDKLQAIAIPEFCPTLKICNLKCEEDENNITQDELLNYFTTDESKEKIKRLLNPLYEVFDVFFGSKNSFKKK